MWMLSVIVPIYNAEKYLEECLQSIANQTFQDIEVILVNDGSTDSSRFICEKFCSKYSNFKLLTKDNGGQMSAWILGVQHAKGEYLGFVDADDTIEPDMYEIMMKEQFKNNSDLVMCSRSVIIDGQKATNEGNKFCYNLKPLYREEEVNIVRTMFLPTLENNLSQARWDKIFKKDLYVECMNKYAITNVVRTFEDRFIVIPYIFKSKSFSFIEKPLYNWRQVKNSSSRKPRPELCDIANKLFESHKQLINDLDIYEDYISFIELEKIDIMRNIFERNLCCDLSRKQFKENAKLLMSKENRAIVLKHKKDCVGKFGKFLYWSFYFKSFFLLRFGAKKFKKINVG